jgi:hypothetical protein
MRISTECGCFASARLSQKDTRGGRFTVSSELVDWEFGWDTPSLPPLEVAAGAALWGHPAHPSVRDSTLALSVCHLDSS